MSVLIMHQILNFIDHMRIMLDVQWNNKLFILLLSLLLVVVLELLVTY